MKNDLKIKNSLLSMVKLVNNNPITTTILNSVKGILAILNEEREIISVNEEFLKTLGISSVPLGLRPGEAFNCTYSLKENKRCGETKYCSSCGAAIAIVISQEKNTGTERFCCMQCKKNNEIVDMALKVKSVPIEIDGKKLLLLFIQDISRDHNRAALERTFFHDIRNMLNGIIGASDLLLTNNSNNKELIDVINSTSKIIGNEIELQNSLLHEVNKNYAIIKKEISIDSIYAKIKYIYENHDQKEGKELNFSSSNLNVTVNTDLSLLLRILSNMITNALESSVRNDKVLVWADKNKTNVTFNVHNKAYINPSVQRRIFQRNFSTKNGDGRGLGTFSMKLFGEKYLNGKVFFSSTPKDGTVFSIEIKQ